MKICSKCKQEKPKDSFFKSSRLGLQPYCKKCHREYNLIYKRNLKHNYNPKYEDNVYPKNKYSHLFKKKQRTVNDNIYSKELKNKAIYQVQNTGQSYKIIAYSLSIPLSTLERWCKEKGIFKKSRVNECEHF